MGMPLLDPHSSLQAPSVSGAAGTIAVIQRQREAGKGQAAESHNAY